MLGYHVHADDGPLVVVFGSFRQLKKKEKKFDPS